MSVTLTCEPGGVWTFHINGVLCKNDLSKFEHTFAAMMDTSGERLNAIFYLDQFEGWKADDDWEDITFFQQHANDFAKMAFVGDPKWEAQALMFVGAGIRRTETRYFSAEQESDAWTWLME